MKSKHLRRGAMTALSSAFLFQQAAASSIASSPLGTGITRMINDISSFMIVLSPSVGVIVIVYFLIRRAMADEQEGKSWQKRVYIALFCSGGSTLASGLISLISSYFS